MKSTPLDNQDFFCSLKTLSDHTGLSVRSLRYLISRETDPLPFYKIERKIIVRWCDWLSWCEQYRRPQIKVNETVAAHVAALMAE